MKRNKTLMTFLRIAFCLSFLTSLTLTGAEVILSFDHFYNHAEMTAALKTLRKANPQFMKLISLEKSHQGRDIWAVILNNPNTGPAEHKSGFYMDGNIHGNEVREQKSHCMPYGIC